MANPTPIALVTLGGVIVCWIFFASIFLLRKRPPAEPEAKRDRRATFGIALQMCGYFLVWFHPPGTAFLQKPFTLGSLLDKVKEVLAK